MKEEKIDFVLTWVDPNDPDWQREKAKYQGKDVSDKSLLRYYRDWDNLRYWFRSVEKFAPWVNSIYFITCNQVPQWLNTDNPKLKLVNHEDYIPEKYLPTFSSRPILLNFHRIPSLSEHFVYFDDDMFLTAPVKPEDFFVKGLPRMCGIETASYTNGAYKGGEIIPIDRMYLAPVTDMAVINRNFSKRKVISENPWKWFSLRYGRDVIKNFLLLPFSKFSAFENFHIPYSYLKSEFVEVWDKEGVVLDIACSHRFRVNSDVNQWLIYYWQLTEGKFVPRSPKTGKVFPICKSTIDDISNSIETGKYKMICLNDDYCGNEFEKMRDAINTSFGKILGEKCSFEK